MTKSLFNFVTIECHLIPSTKTLRVHTKTGDLSLLGLEFLFEIDSLFNWLTNKTEIQSVLIECADILEQVITKEDLKNYSKEKLLRIEQLISKINLGCLSLPQTFVADLGLGGSAFGTELFVGADLKMANINAELKFDHLKLGLFPSGGNISILSELIGKSRVLNWIMSGKSVKAEELESCAYLHSTYDSTNRWDIINKVLYAIDEQSPINRIQVKAAFYQNLKLLLEANMANEQSLANAAYSSEDWKKEFVSVKQYGKLAKLSVVEN